jgi:polysaccharide export outer membrane protein
MNRSLSAFLVLFAANSIAAATPELAARDARYVLQPNDVIEIRYRYTPEFDETVTIQPDGFVSLNLTGDVKLAGMAVDVAKRLLAEKASTRLRDPEIAIAVKDFERPHFIVAGEVTNPGRFDLRGSTMTLEAVAIAGGLRNSAKHSQAILYRRAGPAMASARLVDLKKIATVAGHQEDLELRSGDVLFIPQNRISKVERLVRWGSWGVFANPAIR